VDGERAADCQTGCCADATLTVWIEPPNVGPYGRQPLALNGFL